jgi:hypothetical protein
MAKRVRISTTVCNGSAMRDFDEYVTSLADLDRREIIRQLISADADAQRLAREEHRKRRRTPAGCSAEQAQHDKGSFG